MSDSTSLSSLTIEEAANLAHDKAQTILTTFWDKDQHQTQLVTLAETLGYQVYDTSNPYETGYHPVLGIANSCLFPDTCNIFIFSGEDSSRYPPTTPARHKFSLAHVIGHIVFEDDLKTSIEPLNCYKNACNGIKDLCDNFALNLLMPPDDINEVLKDPDTSIYDLTARYGMTLPVIQHWLEFIKRTDWVTLPDKFISEYTIE